MARHRRLPSPGPRLTGPRNPALDGLRGIAVVAVLLYHADHLRGAFLSVDLFFVLSGYLITALLLAERTRSGYVSIGTFWARRARRLLPVLLAMLVVVGLWARSGVLPSAKAAFRLDAWATLGYVANWRQIFGGGGYFTRFVDPSPLRHAWTLAIEEQFYLLWPLVVVLVAGHHHDERDRARRLFVVSAVGAALSAGTMIVLSLLGVGTDRLYLGTDTRISAILLGAALASHRAWRPAPDGTLGRAVLAVASAASVVLLGFGWALLDGRSTLPYRGGMAVCSLAATVVVADVTRSGPTLVRTVFSFEPLRWAGLISYSLYVWHWPLYLMLTPSRTGLDGWTLIAVRISISVAVAIVSYLAIEQPVRKGRLPSALALPSAAVGVAFVLAAVAIGSAGAVSDRDPGRGDGRALTPGAARLLVVGDSVAHYLAQEGIIPERAALGVAVDDEAYVGCHLLAPEATVLDASNRRDPFVHGCAPAWPRGVQASHPEVVLAIFSGLAYDAVLLDGRRVHACDPPYLAAYERAAEAMVATLGSDGARVVLVSAPPAVTPRIVDEFGAATIAAETACLNDVMRRVARQGGAAFVDLAAWTCPDGECRERADGVLLREDGIHFRHDGARVAARWLVPEVLAAASRGG